MTEDATGQESVPRSAPTKRGRRTPVAPAASEADFQRTVVEAAALHGWRICHTRKATVRNGRVATPTSVPGWPDLVLWNPVRGGVMFVELKTDRGVLSTDQQDVLDSLARAGAVVDVWRPREWTRITELLRSANPDFIGLTTREAEALRAEVDTIQGRDEIAADKLAEVTADAASYHYEGDR
jgi:hypothetical protein